MALKDLIITTREISENLIENVLKGRVELIQEGNKVILTKVGMKYPNKLKILLFLSGGKAWEMLDEKLNLSFSPSEMEKALGIPGNSLRPLLKELSDNFLTNSTKGRYQITSKGIYEIEETLTKTNTHEGDIKRKTKKSRKIGGSQSTVKQPSKAAAVQELILDGYLNSPRENREILAELGRRGIRIKPTSLPSYLLPLVRNKSLMRDHKEKNQGKVWVYTANSSK